MAYRYCTDTNAFLPQVAMPPTNGDTKSMAVAALLIANVSEDPVELIGEFTVFPTGTFAGAHIVLKMSPTEEGTYEVAERYYDRTPRNLSLPGRAWCKFEVANSQSGTSLGLTVSTAE
ncbi:MAG: hypothetical protein KF752_11680 [Pirellulaceae bacterium]|nr:hypothetical protein [Pirellulaceae bacterium]